MNQATPEPNAFLQFWLIMLLISNVVSLIVTSIVAITNRKQRREVNFAFDPASKVEFDKHVAANTQDHRDLFSKIGGVERGVTSRIENRLESMQRDAHDAREKMHERINDVLEAVSELRGRVEEIGKP